MNRRNFHFVLFSISLAAEMLCFQCTQSQTVDTTWIKYIEPSGGFTIVKADSQKNAFLFGHSLLQKYTPDGDLLWDINYVNEPSTTLIEGGMHLDGSGNPVILYSTRVYENQTAYNTLHVKKYDTDNNLLWHYQQDSLFIPSNYLISALDPSGNFYFICSRVTSQNTRFIHVQKLDIQGEKVWSTDHMPVGFTTADPTGLVVNNNGDIAICCEAWSGDLDYGIIKYDTDGNLLWDAAYDWGDQNTDICHAVTFDTEGNVIVTGYTYIVDNQSDFMTIKYNLEGEIVWIRNYGYGDYHSSDGYLITTDNEGNILVGGSSYGGYYYQGGTSYDFCLLQYNSDGDLTWTTRHNGTQNMDDYPFDLELDDMGNIYLSGESMNCYQPGGAKEFTVIKYNADGEKIWEHRNPALVIRYFCDIALTDSDEFYATVFTYNSYLNFARFVPSTPTYYGAEIHDFYIPQQVEEPTIDSVNRRVTITVYDTTFVQTLIPTITTSPFACMYPESGVVTDFKEPRFYNLRSYDLTYEKWWIVTVLGGWGHVGNTNHKAPQVNIFPNPAHENITVQLYLRESGEVQLELYNALAERVAVIDEGYCMAGEHRITINISEEKDGVYLLKTVVGGMTNTQKLIIQNQRESNH